LLTLNYPTFVQFQRPELKKYAEAFLPLVRAFFEGRIFAGDDTSWQQVFHHCLSEALTVDVLVRHVNVALTSRNKPQLPWSEMVSAAFLHDSYKRHEIEKLNNQPANMKLFYQTDKEQHEWLLELGYDSSIVSLLDGFGNNAALRIYRDEGVDLTLRLLHYVDDITKEDKVVTLEERIAALEINPRYSAQNEWSRRLFGGLSLYQAERVINSKTEADLSELIGLYDQSLITAWIQEKREIRLRDFACLPVY